MANKKPVKSKKVMKKAMPVAPVAPREMNVKQNMLGQSESYDKALEASTTLMSHFYHTTLKKYVTEDGNIIESITIPGQGEGADPIKIAGADALRMDLGRLTLLALEINHLQRLRQDDTLDITLNPLNTSVG